MATNSAEATPGTAAGTPELSLETRLEAKLILEGLARERRTETYSGFARRITTTELDMLIPTYRERIGKLLDAVAEQNVAESKGLLPVLIVKKGTNRPSKGFFRFAERNGRNVTNPDKLVLNEQARVYSDFDAT